MTYYVKKCPNCGTINNPSDALCRECKRILPNVKTESETRPPPAITGHEAEPMTESPPEKPAQDKQDHIIQASIVDVNMPFLSMVGFMVKWALAAIPAAIILIFIGVFAFAFLSSAFK